ncbi:hypothetical protein TRAPUB_12644 [Trametes pubescens]|uniref:Uncharacterized protein n=1 Tax=Trametes pubescens TaxID=154538 RepID=A0A1M2VTJ1_TRAPU|nr:hypothetical protein TRAPUB_12644 [Trametes pubescens]
MNNQQPLPDGNNNSEPFSGFFAGRHSASRPRTPMSSARLAPHSGGYTGGSGANDSYVAVDFPAVNTPGVTHTTSLYEHPGGDPLMNNEGSFNGVSAMDSTVTSLAVVTEAARMSPMSIGSGVPAKRGSAVLVQYADREVAAKRLKGDAQEGFVKWCSAGPDEREAALGAMLFSLLDTLRTVAKPQPGVATWQPSDRALRNMNKWAIRLLLSPSLAEYDGDGVVDVLMNIVEKKQIGLPENLRQQDEEKWAVLVGHARGILTNRKSEIKKAIYASMNLDAKTGALKTTTHKRNGAVDGKQPIYHFTKYLADTLGSKSKATTNITVTIQLCTRMAFLRLCTREFIKNTWAKDLKSGETKNFAAHFWAFIDNSLDVFRDMSKRVYTNEATGTTTSKEDTLIMHQLFVDVLHEDQSMFPSSPTSTHKNVLTSLIAVKASDGQTELDRFVITGDGSSLEVDNELDEPEGAE